MRVAIVCQPTEGGVAKHAVETARALVAAGHGVTVVTSPRGWLAERLGEAGVPLRPVDLRRSPTWRDLAALWRIRRELRSADVALLESSKAGALGRLVKGRTPVVYAPHGWSFLMTSRLRLVWLLVERALARRTDALLAVSAGEAEAAAGLDHRRVAVVVNGVDTAVFAPPREAPLEPSRDLVCVGRLAEQKGQDVLLRAAALAVSRPTVTLVGEGPLRAELEALARDLDVDVEVVGAVDDVRPFVTSARIAVVPSRWDGLSFALLEAMALGTPVIASRVAGSEIVTADAGVLVDSDDPVGLAAAVDALDGDETRRRHLAKHARELVVRDHSLEQAQRRTVALLAEVAREGRCR